MIRYTPCLHYIRGKAHLQCKHESLAFSANENNSNHSMVNEKIFIIGIGPSHNFIDVCTKITL